MALEGLAPRWSLKQCRGPGVDGREVFVLVETFSEERDQAPAHQDEFALSGVAIVADDGLVGCRRNVVVPRRQNKAFRQLAEMEGFSDALLVGASVVAAAHVDKLAESVEVYSKSGVATFRTSSFCNQIVG